jgi:hypothetical protein
MAARSAILAAQERLRAVKDSVGDLAHLFCAGVLGQHPARQIGGEHNCDDTRHNRDRQPPQGIVIHECLCPPYEPYHCLDNAALRLSRAAHTSRARTRHRHTKERVPVRKATEHLSAGLRRRAPGHPEQRGNPPTFEAGCLRRACARAHDPRSVTFSPVKPRSLRGLFSLPTSPRARTAVCEIV